MKGSRISTSRSGLPNCQPSGNRGGGGASPGFPCGAPALGPSRQNRDLRRGQFSLVLKARLRGQPGRHVSRRRHGCDQPRAFRGILVGQEAERRDAARAMAGGALPVKDRRHVVRKGRGRRRCPERAHQGRKVHTLYCALVNSLSRSGAPNPMSPPRRRAEQCSQWRIVDSVPEDHRPAEPAHNHPQHRSGPIQERRFSTFVSGCPWPYRHTPSLAPGPARVFPSELRRPSK